MNTGYLTGASNEMFRLLYRHDPPSWEDTLQAATMGCATLGRLCKDSEFEGALKALGGEKRKNIDACDRILGADADDLDNFVLCFLPIEKDIWRQGGVDAQLSSLLGYHAATLREKIRGWSGDPDEVLRQAKILRNTICDIANQMATQSMRAEDRAKDLKALKKAVIGIAGAGIVGLNANALLLTFLLSAPAAAISGGIGSAMIGWALPSADAPAAAALPRRNIRRPSS